MSGDIFSDLPDASEISSYGDQTHPHAYPPELDGTGLAESVVNEVAGTLVPLIERAAGACDSLRDAVAGAAPTEAALRGTLGQINGLLERAEGLIPDLEARTMGTAIHAEEGATTGEDVRAMIDTAVENLGTRFQMQLDLVRAEIDSMSKDIGARIDALATRSPEPANTDTTPAPEFGPAAIDDSLATWETQVGELLRLFRDKAEQAMASVDEIGRTQAAALSALCERAERLSNAPGHSTDDITRVLDEVVSTIAPWRTLLVEGKCGPEISPAVGAIVDRVREEIQDDIGRLGATVNEVAAITSRLAEVAATPAVREAGPSTITAAKPRATRSAPVERPAPAPAKRKIVPAKSRTK